MEHTTIRPTITLPKDNLTEQWGSCIRPLQPAMSSMLLPSAIDYQDMAGRFWCSILLLPDFYYCIHPDAFPADLSSSTPPQAACLGSSPRHSLVFVPLLSRTPHLCICCDSTFTAHRRRGGTWGAAEWCKQEQETFKFITRSFWMAFRTAQPVREKPWKAPQIDVSAVQRVRIQSESLHLLIKGKDTAMELQ